MKSAESHIPTLRVVAAKNTKSRIDLLILRNEVLDQQMMLRRTEIIDAVSSGAARLLLKDGRGVNVLQLNGETYLRSDNAQLPEDSLDNVASYSDHRRHQM